ncbi:MAG: MFS transporter [Chloroflexi bacterium]|nr:MFS transporter [Chloroflexota bacterium]
MQQQVDYSRKWYVMAAVAMSILLATIDGSIVNVALPTLVRDLQTEFAVVEWVLLAYLLAMTTLMPSVGRLGDMMGKKAIYTGGFVVFTAGSVLCGLSPDVHWLIGFRVLQAVGAAMVLALGAAILTEAFPPSERGKALGWFGTFVSIGIVVGPTLGGILIEALSWHWIFFVNLPVGIIGVWMSLRYVPTSQPAGKQTFDYPGAITLFISLLSLLLALTLGQQMGFGQTPILLLWAGWLVFLVLFIVIELKTSQPMINLRLFQNILLSINLITGFLTFVAVAGVFILMPFYLENMLGYSTRQVGYMMAIVPIALGIAAPIAGSLSDRLGTRPITIVGLLALAIGYYGASMLTAQTGVLGYVLRLLPIGIGMGIFQSPNNSAILGSAPRNQIGVVSGLLSTARTLGQTTGVAILGAIWASRVAAYVGSLVEGGATAAPQAAQLAGLQDTFLGVAVLMVLGLGLSVWGLVQERRSGQIMSTVVVDSSQNIEI